MLRQGFASREIAKVMAVAGDMKVEQTRAFRFPIRSKSRAGELWLVMFMDHIDSGPKMSRKTPELEGPTIFSLPEHIIRSRDYPKLIDSIVTAPPSR
jgi:hypothetical protein